MASHRNFRLTSAQLVLAAINRRLARICVAAGTASAAGLVALLRLLAQLASFYFSVCMVYCAAASGTGTGYSNASLYFSIGTFFEQQPKSAFGFGVAAGLLAYRHLAQICC
jgi:H+/gluconate symporter-like permease